MLEHFLYSNAKEFCLKWEEFNQVFDGAYPKMLEAKGSFLMQNLDQVKEEFDKWLSQKKEDSEKVKKLISAKNNKKASTMQFFL